METVSLYVVISFHILINDFANKINLKFSPYGPGGLFITELFFLRRDFLHCRDSEMF